MVSYEKVGILLLFLWEYVVHYAFSEWVGSMENERGNHDL